MRERISTLCVCKRREGREGERVETGKGERGERDPGGGGEEEGRVSKRV